MPLLFQAGAAATLNRAETFEWLGRAGNGAGTSLSGGNNTMAGVTLWSASGVVTNAWAGFDIYINKTTATGDKWALDVDITDNTFAHIIAPKLWAQPQSAGQPIRWFCPLNVPAGASFNLRGQASGAGKTCQIAVRGRIKNANSPPCYTSMVQLDATGNAATNAAGADLALSDEGAPTYVNFGNAASAYDAIAMILGPATGAAAVAQAARVLLSTGAGPTFLADFDTWVPASTNINAQPQLLELPQIAAGQAVQAAICAGTPGTDKARIGAWGLIK